MATVSDITTTPLSGLNYIDALLDTGPKWNYLTDGTVPVNTITYTFSITSGTEPDAYAQKNFTGTEQAFTAQQQAAVISAFKYISTLTGIQFVLSTDGDAAQIHLSNANLIDPSVTGLCSWESQYSYDGSSYSADAYVYLDDVQWASQNMDLSAGGAGYETLLHELGHALGLKHPFDTTSDNTAVLPASQDNTANTLMSYTHTTGVSYQTYRPDDIAALAWLYGGDGLRGALGINSTTGGRDVVGSSGADTLTGTAADDKFQGNGGDDMIDGGAGNDTAVFSGLRSNYTFTTLANGDLQVTDTMGTDGVDTLRSVETLQFLNSSSTSADVAVPVPSLLVAVNANNYAHGAKPLASGAAEAGDTITIYNAANQAVGTAVADSTGVWSTELTAYADGLNYGVYAVATNAAGSVSAHSAIATFNVDAHPPVAPTLTGTYTSGTNTASFSGTGEVGDIIHIASRVDGNEIANTVVGADGKWALTTSPLPNGSYQLNATASDVADNQTVSTNYLTLTVSSADNITGTSGNDTLTAAARGNAIDGGAGTDTVVYAGASSNYTVTKEVWGYGVTDKVGDGGHDAVINVERLQFSDTMVALDVDGTGGEIYRLYQAAFDRPAEAAGLGYWIWRMDNGSSLQQVALEFMTNQKEFTALYGTNPTDAEFVTHLYENVLHREPEGAGYDYWMTTLANNPNARADVLIDFSESPENQAQVIGSIQNGMVYTTWVQPAATPA